MADGDVLVLTGGHQSFSAASAVASGLPRLAISASDALFSSGTVVLSGLGAAVVNTAAGSIRISVPAQTTQPGIANVVASDTTFSSGTVSISGFGNITVNTAANIIRISGSQSVQAETQTFLGALGNSQTTYTSGTVNLSVVAGNLTIRSTTGNAFQFSASQSVQAETQTFVGGIAVNALTTYTSGTVVLSAGANITLGTNAQTVTISGNAAQTVQTQSLIAGVYDGANSISTGTIRFTNANGVSFSVNGQTLSGSVDRNVTMYATSNTTQSSTGTQAASSLIFAGAGIASVGVTGGSVVISVPAGGGAGDGGVFAGVSNLGNTAGSTGTVSTGNLVLVGTNGITLSQSTGAAGSAATVTIIGPQRTESGFNPYADMVKVVGQAQGSLMFDPVRVAGPIQFDRIVHVLHNTNSSNSSGSHTLSFWGGLYTRNVSTLSLLQSWSSSTNITHSGTAGSYSLYSGQRLFTIPFTTTLTAGDYWLGIVTRTTSAAANGSYSLQYGSNINTNFLGHFGSSHNTTYQLTLGQGVYTVTTAGIPNSVGFSQIQGSDSMVRRPAFVMFASSTI